MMVRAAGQQGIDLLKGMKLSLQLIESSDFVSQADFLEIVRRFTEFNNEPDWGFSYGSRLGIATHGPLGFGAMSAPTLGAGLELLVRYLPTRTPYTNGEWARSGESLSISFQIDKRVGEFATRICETLSMVFQSYIESAGGNASPTLWQFPFSEPSHGSLYSRWINGGYRFDADRLRFEVPGSVCMVVSPFYDELTYRACILQCDALMPETDRSLATQVSNTLNQAYLMRLAEKVPAAEIPGIESVADNLGLSRRSLIRKLQQAGTSFQSIKDALMKSMITEMLVNDRKIQEIAERLGYHDAGNFTRACRRLFGCSPSDLRKKLQTQR